MQGLPSFPILACVSLTITPASQLCTFSVLRGYLSAKGSLKDANIRSVQRKTPRESQANPELGGSILSRACCLTGQILLPGTGDAGAEEASTYLPKLHF